MPYRSAKENQYSNVNCSIDRVNTVEEIVPSKESQYRSAKCAIDKDQYRSAMCANDKASIPERKVCHR